MGIPDNGNSQDVARWADARRGMPGEEVCRMRPDSQDIPVAKQANGMSNDGKEGKRNRIGWSRPTQGGRTADNVKM
jgi:hypothetical protein